MTLEIVLHFPIQFMEAVCRLRSKAERGSAQNFDKPPYLANNIRACESDEAMSLSNRSDLRYGRSVASEGMPVGVFANRAICIIMKRP